MTPITLCGDVFKYRYLKNRLCKGRASEFESGFPIFWTVSGQEEAMVKECESSSCGQSDCCELGEERKCSNTGKRGAVEGGFTQEMCGKPKKWRLLDQDILEMTPCTKRDGKSCHKTDCCERV